MGKPIGSAAVSIPLIFNDAALPFARQTEAQNAIPEFLRLLHRLRRYLIQLIRLSSQIDTSWYRLKLADGYYFQDWFEAAQKSGHYRDLIRSFKSFELAQPILPSEERDQILNQLDVGLQGHKGQDQYRACLYYDAVLLSFPSQPLWKNPFLAAWVQYLEQEHPETIQLKNLSTLDTLSVHQALLESRRDQMLQNSQALWKQRERLYPSLHLIAKMSDLKSWPHGTPLLNQGREALEKLNRFAEAWQAGQYPDYQHRYLRELGLEVSGESESIANDPGKRRQREFYLPDGQKVYCENHIKNFSHTFRMHFYPDTNQKQIYVVYFGPHLKT